MEQFNHLIPPAVLLLGATNLTRALYSVIPGFGDHIAGFVPIALALALTACYVVVALFGTTLRVADVPTEAVELMSNAILGRLAPNASVKTS
jgi:hypothetical protein